MSADDKEDKGGDGLGPVKTVLLVIVAVIAGFYGVRLTAWLLKSALWLGAGAAIGYVVYSYGRKKLASTKASEVEDEPKALLPAAVEVPKPAPAAAPSVRTPKVDPEQVERDLEELKRRIAQEDAEG